MNRLFASVSLLVIAIPAAAATNSADNVDECLSSLPKNLELSESRPQRYVFKCDYFQFEPVKFSAEKTRVSAEYTRGLPEGKVQWSNVTIAKAEAFEAPFPEGVPQRYMEGFSYKPKGRKDALSKNLFAGFPEDSHTRTLVWDMQMLEMFAWNYWNHLKLNEPYSLGPSDFILDNGGSFHNRQPELTWIGVSNRNDKVCALIQYEAFFNQLKLKPNGMALNGISHYWGIIWVSLEDKQLEYATLEEEVSGRIDLPGSGKNQGFELKIHRSGKLARKQ